MQQLRTEIILVCRTLLQSSFPLHVNSQHTSVVHLEVGLRGGKIELVLPQGGSELFFHTINDQ